MYKVIFNIFLHLDNRYFDILVWWKFDFGSIHVFIMKGLSFFWQRCIIFLFTLLKFVF